MSTQLPIDPDAEPIVFGHLIAHPNDEGRIICPYTCGDDLTGRGRNYYYKQHYRNRCAWRSNGSSRNSGAASPILDAFVPILARARAESENEAPFQAEEGPMSDIDDPMVSLSIIIF